MPLSCKNNKNTSHLLIGTVSHALCCFLKHLFIYLTTPDLGCDLWALVPWPGIESGPPALEAWSLTHWTIREIHLKFFINISFSSHSHLVLCSLWNIIVLYRRGNQLFKSLSDPLKVTQSEARPVRGLFCFTTSAIDRHYAYSLMLNSGPPPFKRKYEGIDKMPELKGIKAGEIWRRICNKTEGLEWVVNVTFSFSKDTFSVKS